MVLAENLEDGDLASLLKKRDEANSMDGKPIQLADGGEPLEGFDWRTTPDLKVNCFRRMHCVTGNAARRNGADDPRKENMVWFDDIVVAEEYIGPVK